MGRWRETLGEIGDVGFEFGDEAPSSLRSSLSGMDRATYREGISSRAMTRNAVIAQGPASPFFIRPVAGSGRANGQAPIWKCSR